MFNLPGFLSLFALTLAAALPMLAQPAHCATTAKRASWIALRAQTDKQQYVVGEPIQVTLKATNIQSKDAYLKFSSGQRFELKLFKEETLRANIVSENQPVYTWSADKMFAQQISHVQLKRGESAVYQGEIGSEMGELASGIYRLEAQLSNSSQIGAAPLNFKVVPRVASSDEAQQATLTATTDKRVYSVGEAVKVDFALQNGANAPTTFNFNSGQTYDIFVRNAAGDLVWSWAANKRFIMAIRDVTLAAGEKQNFSEQWDGHALPDYEITPGQYTVEAVYASTPAVRAAPVNIEIR